MRSDSERAATRLGVELEAKLLQQLGVEWRSINYSYFKSSMRPPIILLTDARRACGRWHGELRSLELSRALVLDSDWGEVIETLKREAVQQFLEERLSVTEDPHGPRFRRICRRLGIRLEAGAGGQPARPRRAGDRSGRVIKRIHKLLALARSPNRHEAETAATTARRLMFKFNIERVQAPRADEEDGGESHGGLEDERSRYAYRHLGRVRGRLGEHDRRLAKILNEYFFVEGAWLPVYLPRQGQRSCVLEICGLETNLLMAEHVHTFVSRTAQRLWLDYQRSVEDCSEHDRLAFLAGVMKGFETKLEAQDKKLREEGLVFVPGPELDRYFRLRNPRLQIVQPGDASGNEAYEEGSRAGRSIVLSEPVASNSGSGGPPKALRAAPSRSPS